MSDKGIAGHFLMGDGLNHYASDVPWTAPTNAPQMPMSEPELRAFVRREVHKALDELANELRETKAFQPVDTREHRRIEMTEDSGKRFRGVLYRVDETPVEDEAATDPEIPAVDVRVPSGICWACGGYGESAEMMWSGMHLIHATPECVHGAEIKPETREHRG